MNVTIMLEIKKSLQALSDDQQRMQFLHNIGQWVNHEITKLNEKLTTIFLEKVEPDGVQNIERVEQIEENAENSTNQEHVDNQEGTESNLDEILPTEETKEVDTSEISCNNEDT